MKRFRKAASAILAIVLAAALGTGAFADGAPLGESGTVDNAGESVRILKEITVYNPDEVTVNAPEISFSYAIEPGSASKSVRDADGVHVAVRSGVGSPVITGEGSGDNTLVWSPADDTLSANAEGAANTKYMDIDFSAVEFGAAGVYRYVIRESVSGYESNGVVEGSGGHVRFLDVYVRDGSGEGAGAWDVYGFALFCSDSDIDAAAVSAVGKTAGFVSGEGRTADTYYTFNFTVSNAIVNDSFAASTHIKFPFTVSLVNETVTADVLPIVQIADSTLADQDAPGVGAVSRTLNAQLAHGGEIRYIGIPTGTTVTVVERNGVQGATYESRSEGAGIDAQPKAIYTDESSNEAEINNGAAALAAAGANQTAAFTNTLLQISPTGVVLRLAPFVLLFAAGAALLLISRRAKKAAEL